MNPQDDNNNGMHYPPQINDEAGGATDGVPPMAPPEAPPASASWLPPTVPVHAADQNSGAATSQAGQPIVPVPSIADDGDVIEKEWVFRAKQIVDSTQQDPYNQTKELHKFKAEYMQKRYNKTIKAVEE